MGRPRSRPRSGPHVAHPRALRNVGPPGDSPETRPLVGVDPYPRGQPGATHHNSTYSRSDDPTVSEPSPTGGAPQSTASNDAPVGLTTRIAPSRSAALGHRGLPEPFSTSYLRAHRQHIARPL